MAVEALVAVAQALRRVARAAVRACNVLVVVVGSALGGDRARRRRVGERVGARLRAAVGERHVHAVANVHLGVVDRDGSLETGANAARDLVRLPSSVGPLDGHGIRVVPLVVGQADPVEVVEHVVGVVVVDLDGDVGVVLPLVVVGSTAVRALREDGVLVQRHLVPVGEQINKLVRHAQLLVLRLAASGRAAKRVASLRAHDGVLRTGRARVAEGHQVGLAPVDVAVRVCGHGHGRDGVVRERHEGVLDVHNSRVVVPDVLDTLRLPHLAVGVLELESELLHVDVALRGTVVVHTTLVTLQGDLATSGTGAELQLEALDHRVGRVADREGVVAVRAVALAAVGAEEAAVAHAGLHLRGVPAGVGASVGQVGDVAALAVAGAVVGAAQALAGAAAELREALALAQLAVADALVGALGVVVRVGEVGGPCVAICAGALRAVTPLPVAPAGTFVVAAARAVTRARVRAVGAGDSEKCKRGKDSHALHSIGREENFDDPVNIVQTEARWARRGMGVSRCGRCTCDGSRPTARQLESNAQQRFPPLRADAAYTPPMLPHIFFILLLIMQEARWNPGSGPQPRAVGASSCDEPAAQRLGLV